MGYPSSFALRKGDDRSMADAANPAWRLGIPNDEAIVLADDCAKAGLVRHDAEARAVAGCRTA